jgi:parallel beta helix pectate lyase-like protein
VGSRTRGWLAASAALMAAAALIALPLLYQGTPAWPWGRSTPASAHPPAPAPLQPLQLSAVATPVQPYDGPASPPGGDAARQEAIVKAEDDRLQTILFRSQRMTRPTMVPVQGTVPTLVLPARKAPYTVADLRSAGAVIPVPNRPGVMLVDSVFVAPSATLKVGGPGLGTLLMARSGSGSTSLVTWGGTLALAGDSPAAPLAITGWDRATNQAAQDQGNGRPYIRAAGGALQLADVRVSSLGFWTGRTGGVAWTGVKGAAATGGAAASTFVGNTYGAYVSNGSHVDFKDDLFESNQLDGLRLHRGSLNSTVTGSAAARNGGNGFVIARGANHAVLRGDLATHNHGSGFVLDGQPRSAGSSPTASQTANLAETTVTGSQAEANGELGILVVGGIGTVLDHNLVCASRAGIAIRAATGTTVTGNQVTCGGRAALSIGPAATNTTVTGNLLSRAPVGLLIQKSSGVVVDGNWFADITRYAISVRGASQGVLGRGNVIVGRGFQPVDVRDGASPPSITDSDLGGWHKRSGGSPLGYFRYHPLLTTWLVVLTLVIALSILVRIRRRPGLPYRYAVPWHPTLVHSSPTLPPPGPRGVFEEDTHALGRTQR